MDRDDLMRWVAGYERAWREQDPAALGELFATSVQYRRSPYEPPIDGLEALREVWNEDGDRAFGVSAEPVAVDGRDAVVRVEVHYAAPQAQEYRDLWVLRFDAHGKVADFEEWAYWPGKPYTAGE